MRFTVLALIIFFNLKGNGQGFSAYVLSDTSGIIQKVLKDSVKYRLQIIYTRIEESKALFKRGKFELKTEYIRNRPDEYFFPASLVKMPVTALALEKVNELSLYGITEHTAISPMSDFECTNRSEQAPSMAINELIDKIYIYSDNHAFNYLYELCGQAYINERLWKMGYSEARIAEKIARCNPAQNTTTGPVVFYENQKIIHIEGRQVAEPMSPSAINTKVGKGYLWNNKYISSPKDFSTSSIVPLDDFHKMLISIVLPEQFKENERFQIAESQRMALMKSMSTLPRQYCRDSCDKKTKDTHVKYLIGFKDTIPDTWKIYNKVGLAHGFMSDCTYFEDKVNDIRFFLSAVIYVNEDNVLNDGKYEYYNVGFPFMKALGKLTYEYELQRKQVKN